MPGIPGFQRRSPRVEAEHPATLIDSTGRLFEVIVTELSAGGFRLSVGELLTVGEKVRILVERHGEFPAEIRWATADQAGGIFLEPVQLNSI
jgi:hypothetical protein